MSKLYDFNEAVGNDIDNFNPDEYEVDDDKVVIESGEISDLMDYMQEVYNYTQSITDNMKKIGDIVGISYPPEMTPAEVKQLSTRINTRRGKDTFGGQINV